ncbi:MAG: hypothetical protein Kow006_33860 [Gammaproteobacteria bacterium]
MTTLQELREGLSETWDGLVEGWQRLYRRAAGAITRFTPGRQSAEKGGELTVRSAGWGVLASEVYDDDEKIVVRVEAPGMEKSDFDLQVLDNYLLVRGEKQLERESTEGEYRITECAYGRFERAIPLPAEVEADKARAKYRKGVLRIELPKSSRGQRKRLEIEIK